MPVNGADNKVQEKMAQELKRKVFVARQPIFDRDKNIYGYELLFRNGLENFFDESLDKDYASSKVVLDSLMLFDLNELTCGKRAFLNFTAKVLLSEAALAFPIDAIIIELLETIPPDADIVAVCTMLKKKGYMLALDDFEFAPKYQPLIDLADIIKIDVLATPPEEWSAVIEKSGRKNIKFLAEKVETFAVYNQTRDLGYHYFQGYYFSKPVIVSGKEMPSYKINLMQILKEMHQLEVSISKLERIITRDVAISYKLLRFINSAAFGFVKDIHSIRHALNLLGILEFKKWMSFILLSQMGSDKPNELLINSLIRAKFCELTAESIAHSHLKHDFFLMGLLSLIDAFLDRPVVDILKELPISAEIKNAIQGEDSKLGQVLKLIIHYEQSKWETVSELCTVLKLDESKILQHYFVSIKWANDFSIK